MRYARIGTQVFAWTMIFISLFFMIFFVVKFAKHTVEEFDFFGTLTGVLFILLALSLMLSLFFLLKALKLKSPEALLI
jgi:hypothetical protein